jgi:hypothetical protein
MSQGEREEYAMENLRKYIQEVGGTSWRSRFYSLYCRC